MNEPAKSSPSASASTSTSTSDSAPPARPSDPVVLVSGDFVKTGGMDAANFALARHLADAGREVHLVAHRVDESLKISPRIEFHRVSKPFDSYLIGGRLLARRGQIIARELTNRGGRVIVNGGNCRWNDVNWVHYVHAAWTPPIATSAGLLRRIKARVSRAAFLRDEAIAIKQAKLVIANSNRTARDLIEQVGIAAEQVQTIYYGIDPTIFYPASADERAALRARLGWDAHRPIVMFIGALSDRRKGFDSLFAAWRRLCETKSWDADLVVVGQGVELPSWESRAADSGLVQRIRFLGFRSDVPDLLRAADALIAPTRYEAYGLGVHEALCCGLPALVSRSAGVAERYPHELDDLLIDDPTDIHEIIAKLQSWHQNQSDYRTLAAPLAAQLRAYTWTDMAKDFVTAMDAVGQ